MGVKWSKDQKGKSEGRLSRGANLATIVAVPIALIGLLFAYLALGGSEGSGSERTSEPVQLERIDLLASNGLTPGASALELMVHNPGTESSVVSRARIEVVGVDELPLCYTQGTLDVSESYGLVLSPDAQPGDTVEAALHQQIGPGEDDRFRLHVSLGEEQEPRGVHLFELDVSLFHDGLASPLPMGTALLSVPQLPTGLGTYYLEEGQLADLEQSYNGAGFYTPEEMWKSTMPCWQANGELLAAARGSTAVRSQQLEEAMQGAVVPSFAEASP